MADSIALQLDKSCKACMEKRFKPILYILLRNLKSESKTSGNWHFSGGASRYDLIAVCWLIQGAVSTGISRHRGNLH
nr:hypothetical protein [uncultured Draconibacterium sp.]